MKLSMYPASLYVTLLTAWELRKITPEQSWDLIARLPEDFNHVLKREGVPGALRALTFSQQQYLQTKATSEAFWFAADYCYACAKYYSRKGKIVFRTPSR